MGFEESVKRVEVVALELETPLVLDAATPTGTVIREMRERRLGYALLTRDDKLAGILTEHDVVQRVVGTEGALDRPASELMQADPVSVAETDFVRRAAYHMHERGFRYIPVVDADKRVVGCVRHKDIIRYLVEHFADQLLSLPPDPDQLASAPEGG
jgi:signal-transduction protein with cAMP-binding, CBS, and nucleotidyltransferase domain